jgi:hypothetical protein
MWSAAFDESRQVVELRFAEEVDEAQARSCAAHVLTLLPKVSPGFCLFNDLTRLRQMDVGCAPFIDQIMDAFDQKGIRRVVRVVPDPEKDIGFGIMSLFHYGQTVRVITCQSLEEAQQHLPK